MSKTSVRDMRMGRLSSDNIHNVLNTAEKLNGVPIYYDETPGMTVMQIASTARQHKLRHNIGLIVIDYLQLITPEDKSVNRNEQIGSITRRLKMLAKELQIPIIALSQLNREVEKRAGQKPQLSDLRESGSIEQDADVVLLLHREEEKATLNVAKQRNGPTGNVSMTYAPAWTRFDGPSPDFAAINENTQW